MQSIIKQLGATLVKKWQDVHNKEGSHVVVKDKELPPAGKLWRDQRFNRATIVPFPANKSTSIFLLILQSPDEEIHWLEQVTADWINECEEKRQKVALDAFVPHVPTAIGHQPQSVASDDVLGQQRSEKGASSEQFQAESSIAGSLGFEPSSQTSPAPGGIPTPDDGESGARSAMTSPASALGPGSQPSQVEPLDLAYEETQKQEDSDSDGALSEAQSSARRQRDADNTKVLAPAPAMRRSKLSERMHSVSREIEEEERAEAAAKAAASAAEATCAPSANEISRVGIAGHSSPPSAPHKIPEQLLATIRSKATTDEDTRAAGVARVAASAGLCSDKSARMDNRTYTPMNSRALILDSCCVDC